TCQRRADEEADAIRDEDEPERCEHGEGEEPALVPARDACATEERRERRAQPQEAANERDPTQRRGRGRHPAFLERPVHARERPVGLADDDDAVGTGPPAQSGQGSRTVGAVQHGEDRGPLHPSIVAMPKAARQVPGGPFSRASWSYSRPDYQYPREKKPSSASTRMTIRMIQRML